MIDVMMTETKTVDLSARIVHDDGDDLPIVWWGDADNDPCPLDQAKNLSAGPDRNGLYLHISLDVPAGGRTQ